MPQPLRRGPLEDELRAILKSPRGMPDVERLEGRLPQLAAVLNRPEWQSASHETFPEALSRVLREAIGECDLADLAGPDGNMRLALEIDFGFVETATDAKLGKSAARMNAAAEAADLKKATYYHDRASPSPRLGRRSVAIRRIVHRLRPQESLSLARLESSERQGPIVDLTDPIESAGPSAPALSEDQDLHDLFYPTVPDDLTAGFWWRTSTERYLNDLADRIRLRDQTYPLSIYAGADGPSDVGEPIHAKVISGVVEELLRLRNREFEAAVKALPPKRVSEIVDAIASEQGAPYLGSVAQEICRTLPWRTRYDRDQSQAKLRNIVVDRVNRRYSDGLVARGVTRLSFVAKHLGSDVEVLTSYYDPDLEDVASEVNETSPGLGRYSYAPADQLAASQAQTHEVPLFYMAGRATTYPPSSLVIGEADFMNDEFRPTDQAAEVSRFGKLAGALTKTTVIFVGTSLTDPGVLAALAATVHFRVPRYALVLQPKLDLPYSAKDDGKELWAAEGALARTLTAQRFLHLGCIPIFVDSAQQVPQFLRELALKLQDRSDAAVHYQPYVDRAMQWWEAVGSLLVLHSKSSGSVEERAEASQEFVTVIETAMNWAFQMFCETSGRQLENELVQEMTIQLWIRNPATRELFCAAQSTPTQVSATFELPAPVSLIEDTHPVCRTFHAGAVCVEPRENPRALYFPLVLHAPPWNHLPVGVLGITTKSKNAIGKIVEDHLLLTGLERAVAHPDSLLTELLSKPV